MMLHAKHARRPLLQPTSLGRRRSTLCALVCAALLLWSAPAASQEQAPKPQPLPLARGQVSRALQQASAWQDHERFHLRLDEARDDLILGALDAAAQKLEALLPQAPSGYPRHRARLLMARVAMEQGRGQQALSYLEQVPEEEVASAAWLRQLKAEATSMAGDPGAAAPLYASVASLAQESRLSHYARAERAEALFLAQDHEAALEAYEDLLGRYPEYPRRHLAMYRRAQLLLLLGQHAQAARAMQEVWLEFPWKEEGEKARVALEQAPLAQHKPPSPGYAALMERARELRRFKHWMVAERELEDLLAQVQGKSTVRENEVLMQMALVRYERQDYEVALERLEALEQRARARGQGAGLSLDFLLQLQQRAWQRMGEAERAESILKARVARRPAKAGWSELAEFYWSTGDYKQARVYTDRVLRGAQRNSWDYAFLLFKSGDYKRALHLMQRVGGVSSDQSRYWQARALHEMGELEQARQVYQEVAQRWSLSYYAYQARNRMIEMAEQEVHQRLVQSMEEVGGPLYSQPAPQPALLTPQEAPVCAWTEVSAQPAAVAPVPQRAARIHWRGPDDRPSPEAGAGFGEVPDSGQDKERMMPYATQRPLRGAARRAAARHGDLWPHLHTVSFLFDLGMESAARTELREVTLEFRGLTEARAQPRSNRPLALPYKQWAHYIDHRGASRRGFWGLSTSQPRYPVPRSLAGKRALYEHQAAVLERRELLREELRAAMMEVGDFHFVRKMRLGDGPWWRHDPANPKYREMWSEAYPRAFPEYVQRYAAREGLNPYLLWALMTVESAYNPDSVSYADARGLLQVIPKTGGKVAADIGDNRYGPYDLLDPETSIRHGAWYFARLVKKFRGQEPLAIASYNGGPHNVQRWLLHKDHVPLDEFVEEIPFDQARRYTKKVLRFLALFLRLYEDTDELYVGQALSSDILVDPRY